jgi:hypothetical protein
MRRVRLALAAVVFGGGACTAFGGDPAEHTPPPPPPTTTTDGGGMDALVGADAAEDAPADAKADVALLDGGCDPSAVKNSFSDNFERNALPGTQWPGLVQTNGSLAIDATRHVDGARSLLVTLPVSPVPSTVYFEHPLCSDTLFVSFFVEPIATYPVDTELLRVLTHGGDDEIAVLFTSGAITLTERGGTPKTTTTLSGPLPPLGAFNQYGLTVDFTAPNATLVDLTTQTTIAELALTKARGPVTALRLGAPQAAAQSVSVSYAFDLVNASP